MRRTQKLNEALLHLKNYLRRILEFTEVVNQCVFGKVHQNERQYWHQMLIKVSFIRAVSCNLQQYLEDFFLSILHEECELIKNNSYGSALQYSWRILLNNLFKAFYAGLGQLNEANALLHDRGHASDEASID